VRDPASAEAVAAWIESAHRERDPFEQVRRASIEHREAHGPGCSVYPTSSGPLLGVLAAAVGASRILEAGTGLGYSALWLASSGARVETIEGDPAHAELARANVAGAPVTVLEGRASDVLAGLDGRFDLVFSDIDPREMPAALDHFVRLLRPGGTLISANLFLAQFVPDLPDLPEMVEYRTRLLDHERLRTAFVPGGPAISVLGA
jgi:predicted O-methyltransferase YrrM